MAKKQIKEGKFREDFSKLSLTGLTIIMSATLVIYFLWALISGRYLVNFTIDSLVGVVAFVFMLRFFKVKYSIIKKYTRTREFVLIDFLSILLCFLVKAAVKLPFDFSLPILLVSHYVTKNLFKKINE